MTKVHITLKEEYSHSKQLPHVICKFRKILKAEPLDSNRLELFGIYTADLPEEMIKTARNLPEVEAIEIDSQKSI